MRPLLPLAISATCLCLAGCVSAPTPDLIGTADYWPSTLPFSGGPVHIRAELVSGLDGEPTLTAKITPAHGKAVSVVLRATPEGGLVREAVVTVPPNAAPRGAEQLCAVTLEAKLSGSQTVELGDIHLAGTEVPPDAP
jgi:hypothetical protein